MQCISKPCLIWILFRPLNSSFSEFTFWEVFYPWLIVFPNLTVLWLNFSLAVNTWAVSRSTMEIAAAVALILLS